MLPGEAFGATPVRVVFLVGDSVAHGIRQLLTA
jgi:hypothetical protein